MKVLLLLTTAGLDTGPFDLFSNADGFLNPFQTNVNKGALTTPPGYEVTVSDNATMIQVVSTGDCLTSVFIPLIFPTSSTTSTSTSLTSSTSTSTSTTTSTTTLPKFNFSLSAATGSAALACGAISYPLATYSTCGILNVDCYVYNFFSGLPVSGGGNWYKVQPLPNPYAVQIDGDGKVLAVQNPC